jgi:hypothetical protein
MKYSSSSLPSLASTSSAARALSSRRTRDTPSDGVRPDASELAKTSTRDARVVDAR